MCEYVQSLNENADIVELLQTQIHAIIPQAVHSQAKKKGWE